MQSNEKGVEIMVKANFTYKDKQYEVDSKGFLKEFEHWDEDFAEGLAPDLKIAGGLTKDHWDVIRSIRDDYKQTGRCPLVYETCRKNSLRIGDLERLFPTGYFRGACKLAGISSQIGRIGLSHHPASLPETMSFMESYNKTYEVDVRGFLVKPEQWDEYYALHRAYEMKIGGGELTDEHWKVIKFLRESYKKNKRIPTVYETCKKNQLEIEDLERLFPDGYHRGAVKIAGLRVA
jgi:tRNA 2-thiouridine synthesizing protein E